MRQVVRDTFFDFTAQREGFTPFMYCDTLNLVTTGVGNLIDNGARNGFDISANAMAPALSLPWKIKGPGWTSKNPVAAGDASQAEIRESWIRTKLKEQESPGFNKRGGFAYSGFQPLTLDMAGLKDLFSKTMNRFDATLAARYSNYADWPADAQLALMSMAWAMGPGFNFPSFKAATDVLDFKSAAIRSFFKGGGGTLEAPGGDPEMSRSGRNLDNFHMFNTADAVVKAGADRDRLFFPGGFSAGGGQLPSNGTGPGQSGPGVIAPTSIVAKAEKTALFGAGAAAAGLLGWEAFKWWDGRRGKR